jgi:hypothetical protein
VSFAAITLCVASQRVFIIVVVVVYFVIDSFRTLLDTPSYARIVNYPVFQKLSVRTEAYGLDQRRRNLLSYFLLLMSSIMSSSL